MNVDGDKSEAEAEAERLIGIAEKLLHSRDLTGTREFAILAQETEPLLDGSDQILAIADVLLSSEKRINNHHDWYSILQLARKTNDVDAIKKQYRRLALLLHPDKNKYPFADQAFKLVADAWAVLSDSAKKFLYDSELTLFAKVDLPGGSKLPLRRKQGSDGKNKGVNMNFSVDVNSNGANQEYQQHSQSARLSQFWTACPYCYVLYEYPRVYEDCCMRCQNCKRAFHAASIPSLPPLVPEKEAYYCCWGFFPMGFVLGGGGSGEESAKEGRPPSVGGFPSWMPPIFGSGQKAADNGDTNNGTPPAKMRTENATVPPARVGMGDANPLPVGSMGVPSRGNLSGTAPRKRGRPRKNPLPV